MRTITPRRMTASLATVAALGHASVDAREILSKPTAFAEAAFGVATDT